ncbi:tetratricopeptide repeat protein [candidate division KSB1 bacterium]|nr:tetratricopeptide repeat protein [candidate division KSB1 bacterium]
MKSRSLLFVVILIVSAQNAFSGINLSEPDGVGGNFVATNQDKSSMAFSPDGTGAGPGVEFFLKYNINPKTFLTIGTGIQTITDKMMKWESFMTTLLPTFEVKVGYKPSTSSKFSPMVFAGLSAFGFQSKFKMPGSDQVITGDRYYDAALLAGGGFEYALNEKMTFQASGDYRYVASSDLDKKPVFWAAKAGLSYKLKESTDNIYREEIEYPVGDSEIASLDDLFMEDNTSVRNEEADALALLFQPEEAIAGSYEESANATEYSGSTESNLFFDDLNQSADPINLESRVSATEAAIADLSSRMAGGYTSASAIDDASFKAQYQESLNKFYAKDFNSAIQMFQNLLQTNPSHKLASNCQYWIGESYNATGRYNDAINSFSKVMDYRSSYKFDDALIMNGVVYMKMGNKTAARENFQQLVSKYPTSEYAPKAMRYLGRL